MVYVDGFNLFYGLLKGTPNMWLDLELFVRSLLTSDAYENRADAFVLVSGDADHAAALSAVRRRLGKKTVVFNPHDGECVELRKLSTYYRNIPRDLPGKCQLPDEVTLANGRVVHRPAAWMPCRPGGS